MTLTIYTPSLTMDLDDPDTLAIARDGYKRKIAASLSRIWFESVEEKLAFNWVGGNETRALHLATLHTLAEAAGRALNPHDVTHVDYARRPYLIDQAPGELAPRYALLEGLHVPQLDARIYSQQPVADLDITWQREGLWRLTPPGAAATAITSISGLANHDYAAAQHWFGVPSPLKGDAPSPLDLTLAWTPYPYAKVIVAVLPRPEQGFPDGPMYYFANNGSVTMGSKVTATGQTVPGNQMWSWTSSSAGEYGFITWSLLSELQLLGRYRVYALSRSTNPGDFTFASYHGQGLGMLYGDEMNSPGWEFSGTSWSVTHLGNINIPAYGYNARIASSGYTLGLRATRNGTGSSTLNLAGIFLVPVNGLVYTADAWTTESKLWIDSSAMRTWATTSGNVINKRNITTEGEYPHLLNPQIDHRVYIYCFADNNYIAGKTADVTVGYWPRTYGLAKFLWGAS